MKKFFDSSCHVHNRKFHKNEDACSYQSCLCMLDNIKYNQYHQFLHHDSITKSKLLFSSLKIEFNENLVILKSGSKRKKVLGLSTVGIQSLEIGKKVLGHFDNVFHVYLMNGLQKYQKKKIFTVAFRGRRGRRGQTTSKLKTTKILL